MISFQPGTTIGKYQIGKKLGQGGFGVVFLAHDTSLDREVALKFLNPEHTTSPQILQRFLQEARSAAKISHPGIVTVFECGQIAEAGEGQGAAFIAMERLDGESLTDRLARSGRLAPESAMEIGRQVAAALDAAHRAGIVHRDLKPDNIFLVHDPAVVTGERVKVLDFGIAKLGRNSRSGDLASVQTQSMMVFGTPRYMSPEQCKSAANVDARSDIYTLGCILYELVAGQPPFDGAPGELIARHVLVEAPDVAALAPDAPPHLTRLIGRMLAKEPDDRPATMAHVMRELESSGAMSPGLAPTLAPSDFEQLPRARASTAQPAVRSLGVRPGSQGLSVPTPAPANPTTLAAASGSSLVSLKKKSRVGGIAVIAGALVVVGVGAWWLGARSHGDGGDGASAPHAAEAPKPGLKPEPVEKPAAKPPVEAPPVTPVAPKPEVGTLSLASTPACDVLVDGAAGPAHRTPAKLDVPAGKHTIAFACPGVHDVSTVDVKANQTTTVVKDFRVRPRQVTAQPPPQKQPPAQPPQTGRDGTVNPFAQ